MNETFAVASPMPVAADDLYAWHARPGAFARLQPPWERVELVEHTGGVGDGARLRLRTRIGPFWLTWTARHEREQPGRRFVDVQERGPFAFWRHEHRCEPGAPADSSRLVDQISYRLPAGPFGRLFGGGFVRRKLARMFRYRHAVTRGDLDFWRAQRDVPRMKIAITGATGLVGAALTSFLTTQGHSVVGFSRSGGPGMARWNPARQEIDLAALREVDAVVHLAGANLADGRWTAARKRELVDSRVQTTRWLVDVLGRLSARPSVFLCASATGYYGDTGAAIADETTPVGTGFLAELCHAWEAEAQRAESWGARVVSLRTGVVLTPAGGALAKLLPVFRSGLGGPLAGGNAWMSWIALDDVLGAITHLLGQEAIRGPVNLVAPAPVTNADFTRTLGHVVNRPAVMPVPAVALRLLVGEMADEALLASSRVHPGVLLATGYQFRWPELEAALRHELGM